MLLSAQAPCSLCVPPPPLLPHYPLARGPQVCRGRALTNHIQAHGSIEQAYDRLWCATAQEQEERRQQQLQAEQQSASPQPGITAGHAGGGGADSGASHVVPTQREPPRLGASVWADAATSTANPLLTSNQLDLDLPLAALPLLRAACLGPGPERAACLSLGSVYLLV